MTQKYCNSCERYVGLTRNIGLGDLILVLMTAGIWILFLPLNANKCSICKATNLSKSSPILDNELKHSNLNIADEITKLNDLKENGVISKDEFNKQKNKLLS